MSRTFRNKNYNVMGRESKFARKKLRSEYRLIEKELIKKIMVYENDDFIVFPEDTKTSGWETW